MTDTPPKLKLKFRIGDSLAGDRDYCIIDRDPKRKEGEARFISRGNAGVVYRARYKELLDRAIKFLSPDVAGGDEQAQQSMFVLSTKFKREIQVLSKITHSNIVKIVDFGSIVEGSDSYQYYVMDFIEGKPFNEFCQGCEARDFLLVLNQIVHALTHLHALGYCHIDIKESNILVQYPSGSEPHAVVLDLGGAKPILNRPAEARQRTSRDKKVDSERTIYISSPDATRKGRRVLLGKEVSIEQLQRYGVDLDLYSVGRMLQTALDENERLRSTIRSYLLESGLIALRWITGRLVESVDDEAAWDTRYYKSMARLREDLQRLWPEYMYPLGLEELSLAADQATMQLSREHLILSPRIMDVVNHPLFQRLRNIEQLDYTHLIYPGARHSRFEHALSTFQLARRFLSRLLQYPEFRMTVSPEQIRASLLVALLHDIGHYPLSHMFEDFVETPASQREVPGGLVHDEDLFRSFVTPGPDDRFAGIIKDCVKRIAGEEPLDSLLRRSFGGSYELLETIMYDPRSEPPLGLLHSLIDSAIDVDKIAYLIADSAATGVPFGQGIDVDGLINALVPPRADNTTMGPARDGGAIAITEDGLGAAEGVVLARFWMLSRVYWHRTNRAIMAMHKFVIADLLESRGLVFEDYFRDTLFYSQIEATNLLAKRYAKKHRDGNVANPLAGLIGANRYPYKRILTLTNGPDARDSALYQNVYESLMNRMAAGVLETAEAIRNEVLGRFGLRYGDVVIDIPHKKRDRLGGSKVIVYLNRAPNTPRDLVSGENPVSEVLRNLAQDFEQSVKKCRVFVSPEAMQKLTSQGQLEEAASGIRRYFENKYRGR